MPPESNRMQHRSRADDRQSETAGRSRRSFLAGAGATVAGLTTAGCVEVLPPLGQSTRYESVDMPPADPPRYREWVPEFDGDYLHRGVGTVATPSDDAEAALGFPVPAGTAWIARIVDYFGVGIENYDLAFELAGHENSVFVLEGPVAPAEVADTVLGSGYEEADPLEGYERYVREDDPRTVAVTDGRILFGKGPDRDAAIQYALDTYEGNVPRATEDPAFERVTDEAGLRPLVWVREEFAGYFEEREVDRVAICMDYDEDGVVHAMYFAFEGEAPSREAIHDEVTANQLSERADAIEVVRDGDLGGFEARIPPGTAEPDSENARAIPPQITWGIERSDDEIVLRHEAGDAVPAASLVVATGYEDGDQIPADVQFDDQYESVSPGATLRVPTETVPDGERLEVWFLAEDTEMVLIDVDP